MITEFTSHTSAVNVVQFHPNEYLLASGSADRYWMFLCVSEWMKGWCQCVHNEAWIECVRCCFCPDLLLLAPSVFCIFAAGLLSCGTWRNSTWLARQRARRELWGGYQFSSLDVCFSSLTLSWILCLFCRSILFNPDGGCLYSGSENTLRVYGWEPDRCFDVVHAGWGKVSDLAISNNQMVCTSYTKSFFFFLHADMSGCCTIWWTSITLAFWDD